jgi:hypothetical protein
MYDHSIDFGVSVGPNERVSDDWLCRQKYELAAVSPTDLNHPLNLIVYGEQAHWQIAREDLTSPVHYKLKHCLDFLL